MQKDSGYTLPELSLENCTATEKKLLAVISELQAGLSAQSNKIAALEAEIRRLKKHNDKPKMRPSKLPKNPDEKDQQKKTESNNAKRSGSSKRQKNKSLTIDKVAVVPAQDVPPGSRRKGYQDFVVQDLEIKLVVTQYRLERWQLPDGTYIIGKLPVELDRQHFGPTLRTYILHQHHHQGVTQPLVYQQLQEWGVDISKGQLNTILTEKKDRFHDEKKDILSAGLSVSDYIHVDDTGARHKGQNGYCTHIGNELFAWFESTRSKSRVNFLELLRQSAKDYRFTRESFAYMKDYKVASRIIDALQKLRIKGFKDKKSFEILLKQLNIQSATCRRIVIEAALIGSIMFHDSFSKNTVIMSDDAGQFNVFQHALCWIHAERGITQLLPSNDLQAKAIEWARSEIWDIYHLLLDYKLKPDKKLRTIIQKRFNAFCRKRTDYYLLNSALKRLQTKKHALLMVLTRPETPLHNNLSERDIREYVKRRKVSGSTRSDEGRKCRDTFASLKKTSKKLGINFWNYLYDRLSAKNHIPPLSELILEKAALAGK